MDSTLKTKLTAIQSKSVPSGKSAVTDPVHYLDPDEFNTLVDVSKAIIPDVEQAQADITDLQADVATAQSTANAASTAASTAQTAASNASTAATNAQNAANAAQSDVDALALRVDDLEQNPVATVEVWITSSSGNLTTANAATYKMAIVNDGINPVEIWASNGTDTWTQFAGGGSGGFNYSPKINGFGLKPNSVSANGWIIQVASISDSEADPVNGTIIVDSVDYQTLSSILLGVPLEWAVTGQAVGTHSCILKIYDEAHAGGITATVTVKLVLPTSTLTATATKSQMIVSGTTDIATQTTITKIRVAYQLQGTDANADAAVSAGRYFDLTAGGDITSFQSAGYTKTSLNLTPGATYIPSVQITANTGTGVSQTGGWTVGSSMLIDPAPTAPVISATTTGTGNVTVTLTTPSTDATPETPTYDIAVLDSVGGAWVAKQTGIAANSVYLTGTALGTSYANGTTLQVRVTAKDTHSNAMDSNIVNLTVTNQAPTATSVSISGTGGVGNVLTGNYTYSDAEGNTQGTSTFRWLRNGVAISGATSTIYTQAPADAGTTITFEVTPVATSGTLTGTPVVSAGLSVPGPLTFTDSFTAADGSAPSASWYKALRQSPADGAAFSGDSDIKVASNQMRFYIKDTDNYTVDNGFSAWGDGLLILDRLIDLTKGSINVSFTSNLSGISTSATTPDKEFAVQFSSTRGVTPKSSDINWIRANFTQGNLTVQNYKAGAWANPTTNSSSGAYNGSILYTWEVIFNIDNTVTIKRNGTTLITTGAASRNFTQGYIMFQATNHCGVSVTPEFTDVYIDNVSITYTQ